MSLAVNLIITEHLPEVNFELNTDIISGKGIRLKKVIRGKVPFSELDNLLKEVIEQAEGQYGDWPLEA